MMHPFICDSPVIWMAGSDGLTGRVYQASELCRDSVLSPSTLHTLHSRVFTWREFFALCGSDPQWLKHVSFISHTPLMNKLIWIDTGSSTCYTMCLWIDKAALGWQIGKDVAAANSQGKLGERINPPRRITFSLDKLAPGRCLASSKSLYWRPEVQQAVPSSPHFCDYTGSHQIHSFMAVPIQCLTWIAQMVWISADNQ